MGSEDVDIFDSISSEEADYLIDEYLENKERGLNLEKKAPSKNTAYLTILDFGYEHIPSKNELKEIILNNFNKSSKENYLKTLEEISEIVGAKTQKIFEIIQKNPQTFCRDSKGKITTRDLYKKHAPFVKKIASTLNGRII